MEVIGRRDVDDDGDENVNGVRKRKAAWAALSE